MDFRDLRLHGPRSKGKLASSENQALTRRFPTAWCISGVVGSGNTTFKDWSGCSLVPAIRARIPVSRTSGAVVKKRWKTAST